MIPIRHEPPSEGLAAAFEYPLPVDLEELTPAHYELIRKSDWFLKLTGFEKEEISKFLRKTYAQSSNFAVVRFSDFLRTFVPSSIVICEQRVWLALKNADGITRMVRQPRELNLDEKRIMATCQDPDIVAFFEFFYGCREEITPYYDSWAEEIQQVYESEVPNQWADAIYIFGVSTGDSIIISSQGVVGRLDHEKSWSEDAEKIEDSVKTIAGSFILFLDMYICNALDRSRFETIYG